MGIFDSASFLNSALGGSNATRRDPLPAGETTGQITKIDLVSGEKDGRAWYKLNSTIELNDSSYLASANRERATITYGIMLDMNEGGGVAMGPNKNVQLGKLREACGVNQPGKTLNDMVGQFIRVVISHRPDKDDPSVIYDDVKAVAKL